MKKFILLLLLALSIPSDAQTVWASTDASGNVTGFYANGAPVPPPPNCCTQMLMSDSRITAFLNPAPTPYQIYAAAINAGLAVTSASTPSLNGTYSVTMQAQSNFAGVTSGLANTHDLPNGASTIIWYDASGAPHNFTSTQLLALADAVRNYVYDLIYTYNTLQAGGTASWPAATATIP